MAAIDLILEHDHKCPLCETESAARESKPSNADQSPDEDAFVDDHTAIGNDSGELDSNMAAHNNPRPKRLDHRGWRPTRHGSRVTPNPHHLIPGNESLKPSKILDWIFESKGKVKADVGYDVTNHRNGKWLPSNNTIRGDSTTGKASRWTPPLNPRENRLRGQGDGRFARAFSRPATRSPTTAQEGAGRTMASANAAHLPARVLPARQEEFANCYDQAAAIRPFPALHQRLNGVSQPSASSTSDLGRGTATIRLHVEVRAPLLGSQEPPVRPEKQSSDSCGARTAWPGTTGRVRPSVRMGRLRPPRPRSVTAGRGESWTGGVRFPQSPPTPLTFRLLANHNDRLLELDNC